MDDLNLFILDPIETLIYSRDSSFVLGLEAEKRGLKSFFARPEDLFVRDGELFAKVQAFQFTEAAPHYKIQSEKTLRPVDDFRWVHMRKDPPFDLNYYMTCQYLCLAKTARVINNPTSLMTRVEKFYPYLFPGTFPPTLISAEIPDLLAYIEQYKDVVVKPITDRGGAGLLRLTLEDKNTLSALEIMTENQTRPIIAQQYLPSIRQGDVRALIINFRYVGGFLRVPSDKDNRSNLHIGGRAENAALSARQQEILESLLPVLKQDGIYFAGVDLIGDFLTEINITSPTGLQALKKMTGIDGAKAYWDGLLS